MDAQHHAELLHPREYWIDVADVRDPARAVGRRPGRVKLGGDPHALFMPARDLVRAALVGQIAGHQRGEARRRRLEDALAILARGLDRGDGRHQIGHDDRARELTRGIRRDLRQHLAVAQMHVPVVGLADGQGLRCHVALPN